MDPSTNNPDIERLARVAGMTQTIYDHPEAGPELDRLIEKVFPDAKNPRAAIRAAGEASVAEVKKVADEVIKRIEKDKADRELSSDRAAIREFGFTDADLPAIEDLMTKETIGNYRTAAEMLALRRETAPVGAGGPARWTMPGQASGDRYKGIVDARGQYNPKWVLERAYEAFNDVQREKKAGTFGL